MKKYLSLILQLLVLSFLVITYIFNKTIFSYHIDGIITLIIVGFSIYQLIVYFKNRRTSKQV